MQNGVADLAILSTVLNPPPLSNHADNGLIDKCMLEQVGARHFSLRKLFVDQHACQRQFRTFSNDKKNLDSYAFVPEPCVYDIIYHFPQLSTLQVVQDDL